MHVANIRPKKNWSTLEDLVTEAINETGTLAEGKTYEIYNNGGATAQVLSQEKEPTAKDVGRLIPTGQAFRYTMGANVCYIKAPGACDLHIEEV